MVFKGKAKELVSKELDKKVFLLYWNSLVRKFFEQKKGKRTIFRFYYKRLEIFKSVRLFFVLIYEHVLNT